tara:strand:- start:236 stop:541 length:306 start_codon:yes stop_codon:yes gene_type:complete
VSLKQRKTTQATLVRKLSGHKKNHPLLEALTEYNRLIKANYLLNYIDDACLRNYVQRALTRGRPITNYVERLITPMGISSGVAQMKKSNFETNEHGWSPTP